MTRLFQIALLSLPLLAPASSWAQEEGEESFDDVEGEEITKPTEKQVSEEQSALKDVVHGVYVQAMMTDTAFLGITQLAPEVGPVGDYTNWGLGLRTALGVDVLDQPRFGLALELAYYQAAFNGYGPADAVGSPIQGDFRSHTVQVAARPAIVLSKNRRWSLYGKVSGGAFRSEVLTDPATHPVAGVHGTFKPFGGAALGLEYYSKLSHFSVTFVEAELLYILGFDASLGVNFVGLKYTF